MSIFNSQNQIPTQFPQDHSQSEKLQPTRFHSARFIQILNRWRSHGLSLRHELESRRREWRRLPLEEQQRREVRLWMWGAGILLTFITSLSVFDARQARSAQSLKIPDGLRLIRVQLIGPDHEAAMEWPDDVNRVDLYTSESTRPLLRGVDLWRSSRGPRGSFSVLLPETLLSDSGLPLELKLPLRAILRSDSDLMGETNVSTTSASTRHQSQSLAKHATPNMRSPQVARRGRKPIIHTEFGIGDGTEDAQTTQLGALMEDDEDAITDSSASTSLSEEHPEVETEPTISELKANAAQKFPPQHTEDD